MNEYNAVLYEVGGPDDAVCTISMNRPDQRNAINREMADELLLSSQRVVPAKLRVSGFEFEFPELVLALRHVLGK